MFGNKLKKVLVILYLGSMLFSQSLSVAASESSMAQTSEKPRLVHFVTFIDPPYIFDKDINPQKGLIELIVDELMSQIDMPYDLVILPAKRAEIAARTTKNTCIVPIERSQEREVHFSWISPILISHHGFFSTQSITSRSIKLATLKDALPYRIGSYLGSGIGDYLKDFNYQVDFATQNSANIHKLKYGRIDLWASDILSAHYISELTNIDITQSKLDFFTSLRAIACHPSMPDDFIQLLQDALQFMYQSGKIYHIKQRFKATMFAESIPEQSATSSGVK